MGYCMFACLLAILAASPSANADLKEKSVEIMFENDYLRCAIGPDGRSSQFVDKTTGKNYCLAKPATPFAFIKKGDKQYDASEASYADGRITAKFGESGVSAVIGVTVKKRYVIFEVLSVSGDGIEGFTFVDIPLTLKGARSEPFVGCVLALNLQTNVPGIPRASKRLTATCYSRFGFKGAKAAIIGCPMRELRPMMQEVVTEADELPHSPLGGPWALDSPANRGSYMFNFSDLTEQTVDEWIKLAKNLGITQIDFHGGGSFRFGDCRPNPDLYPRGKDSFKAVIDKLHAAGILAGQHTYAFFIDKNCPWVTPVPDPRLGKDATMTLTSRITKDAPTIPVIDMPAHVSTITGFFVRNSVTIQIDNELITYATISPKRKSFTNCTRGAYGTTPAPHDAGAKVYHLKECFGLFTPDGNSTLLEEVAQASADFYNYCGFDMMYLDALDGEDVLGEKPEEGWWHYGSKFVFELFKRLKKPPIMEMSTFHHHLWYVRSRNGAWDHPVRNHKRFIDAHCESNASCEAMFMPAHLGWWAIIATDDPRKEPTFADDIEYLCAKCVGYECGLSPQGFTPDTYAKSYNLQRLGAIIKKWENLRLAGTFSEPTKAKLRKLGDEYTLVDDGGKPKLRPVQYEKHKVEGLDSPTNTWRVNNKFGKQPARLRIEALMSAGPYDAPDNIVLADFKEPSQFADKKTAPGVSFGIESSTQQVKSGDVSGKLAASREADDGDKSWAVAAKDFSPDLDLRGHEALGVWVHGDGQGEIINIQLKNAEHVSGGLAQHYVIVDFTGWRYFEMIEPEGDRIDDYIWPASGWNIYSLYRELVEPAKVHHFSIWYNNIPAGKSVNCYLSPVKALPLVKTKLVNPSIEIGGKKIIFPVELESGQYIEFNSSTDCKVYNADGDMLGEITLQGDAPDLEPGENTITFSCAPPANGASARARVTAVSTGEMADL